LDGGSNRDEFCTNASESVVSLAVASDGGRDGFSTTGRLPGGCSFFDRHPSTAVDKACSPPWSEEHYLTVAGAFINACEQICFGVRPTANARFWRNYRISANVRNLVHTACS
jgi:hypothetical protein